MRVLVLVDIVVSDLIEIHICLGKKAWLIANSMEDETSKACPKIDIPNPP